MASKKDQGTSVVYARKIGLLTLPAAVVVVPCQLHAVLGLPVLAGLAVLAVLNALMVHTLLSLVAETHHSHVPGCVGLFVSPGTGALSSLRTPQMT